LGGRLRRLGMDDERRRHDGDSGDRDGPDTHLELLTLAGSNSLDRNELQRQ
jgi:hypothetical protein